MSVIVWDGTTLAADSQTTNGNIARASTKIWKRGDTLMAGVGALGAMQAMLNWIEGGMKPDQFPTIKPDDQLTFIIIPKTGKPVKFEDLPYPIPIEDGWYADGSGRDFAYGALSMGADARRAVEIACRYDIYCGGAVTSLTLK